MPLAHGSSALPSVLFLMGSLLYLRYIKTLLQIPTALQCITVFARSVAAATNVFNLSQREATIQERLLFESGVYLFDCALPQEVNDYVMVFVNV